jgi:peptide/nickel transport system permease protein
VTAPIDVEPDASPAALDALAPGTAPSAIQGRSLSQIAWGRLRRDKVAISGGIVVLLLILVGVFANRLIDLYGHPYAEFNSDLVDPTFQVPTGRLGGAGAEHWLGVEPTNGRDVFSRIIYGARISLTVAFLATALTVVIGTFFGIVAGYVGGTLDNVISRVMDTLLAFPLLLFAIALVAVAPETIGPLKGNAARMAILVFVIGFFQWPYIGRIVRGQTLSLREREFVEAARSLGARGPRILFRELLPNLWGPILVYTTLIIPQNILFEAALSFLGIGVKVPTPSWGDMLSSATQGQIYQLDPMYMIVPGMALFITVMAFNLFGDGLRDALDPRSNR